MEPPRPRARRGGRQDGRDHLEQRSVIGRSRSHEELRPGGRDAQSSAGCSRASRLSKAAVASASIGSGSRTATPGGTASPGSRSALRRQPRTDRVGFASGAAAAARFGVRFPAGAAFGFDTRLCVAASCSPSSSIRAAACLVAAARPKRDDRALQLLDLDPELLLAELRRRGGDRRLASDRDGLSRGRGAGLPRLGSPRGLRLGRARRTSRASLGSRRPASLDASRHD